MAFNNSLYIGDGVRRTDSNGNLTKMSRIGPTSPNTCQIKAWAVRPSLKVH